MSLLTDSDTLDMIEAARASAVAAERARIADWLELRAEKLPVKYSPTHASTIERAVLQHYAQLVREGQLT